VAWVFLSWFFTRLTHDSYYTLFFSGLLLVIAMGTTYLFNYYLIPNFLLKKRYLVFGLLVLFVGLLSLWIEFLGILGIFLYLLIKFRSTGQGLPFFLDPVLQIAGLYFVIIAGVMIHLIRISFSMQAEKLTLQNRALETENRLRESELNAMRNQFHPHFLFNTLNNLYWLTLNKSDEAPQLVLKLSDLLDYSLYGCKNDRVPVSKEIDYIRNYLDIMKIRFQDTSDIRFNIQGETDGRMVTPLIFIIFVENACKHGLATLTGNAFIDIDIEIGPAWITFSISNNYHLPEKAPDLPAGIGLVQVKSLLNLTYPEKHKLTIQKDDNQFKANLILHD
jgi:sensor histidine kinase YesM